MSPPLLLDNPVVTGFFTSILAAAAIWLAVRVKKYGKGWWVNHKNAKTREIVNAVLPQIQIGVNQILEQFSTNGGSSMKDDLNALRAELRSTKNDLGGELVETKQNHDDFREHVTGQLSDVHHAIGECSSLIVTLTNRVVELQENVKAAS